MKSIATLGPIGYLPAPGTWASLLTMIIIYLMHIFHFSWLLYAIITILILIIGAYSIKMGQPQFKDHDPREIVIDEMIGCLIAFFCIPFSIGTALVGFVLFRFFDITKICGISWLEHRGKIAGIILDDVGAGLLTNILLHVFMGNVF